MPIYIQSAEQISSQQPLSDAWFDSPIYYDTVYARAVEPNYRDFLEPNMVRRMGKILKRAMITARMAAKNSGIAIPDAIVSGTGLGCVESTELFLENMVRNGEELLNPTQFMQSTHNTIGSLIAIDLKCHGYNNTYMQKGLSFENALLDAYLQFSDARIKTALVGGYDEMTPNYQLLLSRIGYWRAHQENVHLQSGKEAFASEVSVSFMLSDSKDQKSFCSLQGVDILYKPSIENLQTAVHKLLQKNNLSLSDVDAVVVGTSGNQANDEIYNHNAPLLFGEKPLLAYKPVFGESYTASGLGLYVAATCLRKQRIPKHLLINRNEELLNVKTILCYNQYEGKNHALTLLTV